MDALKNLQPIGRRINMNLKFKGKEYRGFDPFTEKTILVKEGASVSVSDEKGKQLLKDFPTQWEVIEFPFEQPIVVKKKLKKGK